MFLACCPKIAEAVLSILLILGPDKIICLIFFLYLNSLSVSYKIFERSSVSLVIRSIFWISSTTKTVSFENLLFLSENILIAFSCVKTNILLLSFPLFSSYVLLIVQFFILNFFMYLLKSSTTWFNKLRVGMIYITSKRFLFN